jgi:hypothetical protein
MTTTSSSDSKMIDRVLKLYALAAGTSFSHEADTARRMAEELIAKHNITLPSVKDRAAFAKVTYNPHFRGAQWEYMLAVCATALCGCTIFYFGEYETFALVGTIADLEACQYLLAFLHEQRMRDWIRAKAKGTSDSFYSFCFSFARGVEKNVESRLTRLEKQRTKEARLWCESNGISVNLVEPLVRGRVRSEVGRIAGQSASLHRGYLASTSDMRRIA